MEHKGSLIGLIFAYI